MPKGRKIWLLFDGRYRFDEDRAVCLSTCGSEAEARAEAPDYGADTVIVEAEFEDDAERVCSAGKIIN